MASPFSGSFLGMATGGILDAASSAWQQDKAEGMQDHAQHFSADQARINRQFQEDMSNTAYQRGTKDMIAAGLNPMLAYSQGGASTPSGSAGGTPGGRAADRPQPIAAMQSAANIELTQASADKERAIAEETRARTPTHEVNIRHTEALIRQTMDQSDNVVQQTRNLKELIPNIRETNAQIRQQTELMLQKTNLTDTQRRQVQQFIDQNLPQLERALGELEETARKLLQPGLTANAAAADSLTGQLGAYARALNPFQQLMGIIPFGRR